MYVRKFMITSIINLLIIKFPFQVWFQNRRMKDKRQRIAVAWPYAAVYSDPAFAASILQAAASSVAMPYGYPPGTILPPMSTQLPSATSFPSYGYRYSPYPIPARSHMSPYTQPMLNSMSQNYAALNMPHKQTPSPLGGHQSPSSPHSTSLSPGSDKNRDSPVKSNVHQGLLMAASTSPTTTAISNHEKPKLFKPYKCES